MKQTSDTVYRTSYLDSVLANNCHDKKMTKISGVFNTVILKEEPDSEVYVEVFGGPEDGKRFLIFRDQLVCNEEN